MYRFSAFLKRTIESFNFALRGLWYVIRTQRHFHFHLFAAFVVVLLGCALGISAQQWLSVVITIFIVFSAEAFNTAIEKLVDMVSPEYNKLAGLVKDIAAGAVLLTAIMAIVVGIIVFLPPLWRLFF